MLTSKPVNLDKQIESLYNEVQSSPSVQGWQIPFAPIAPLTAPDLSVATGTYSTGTRDIINNHTTRLVEIEAALVRLNLLKPQ